MPDLIYVQKLYYTHMSRAIIPPTWVQSQLSTATTIIIVAQENRDHTISIRLMFALVFAVECAVVFAPNPRRLSQTLEHRSSSTHKAHTHASVRTQTRFDTSCLLWPVHSRLSRMKCVLAVRHLAALGPWEFGFVYGFFWG